MSGRLARGTTMKRWILPILLAWAMGPAVASAGGGDPVATAPELDAAAAGRFARLALDCVHLEYPNKIAQVMQSDADAKPPRELTPAFYGCYDWHSSVHGHWLLVRLVRLFPDADFVAPARAALAESLTEKNIQAEVEYLRGPGRASLRTPLRTRVAAEAGPGDQGLGRPAGQGMGARTRAARGRVRAALRGLAAETQLPDSQRRAQPDGFRLRPAAGLGRRVRRCRNRAAARRQGAQLLRGGP